MLGGDISSGGGALHLVTDFPDDSGEFAGDGNLDLVMVHEALLELDVAGVEAVLRLPGDFPDPPRLVFLAHGERGADRHALAVVDGKLNKYPAEMGIAAFGTERSEMDRSERDVPRRGATGGEHQMRPASVCHRMSIHRG